MTYFLSLNCIKCQKVYNLGKHSGLKLSHQKLRIDFYSEKIGKGLSWIYKGSALYSKKTQKMVKKWFLDPLESMVKKWSFDGSGPPQEMCPKSGQKIVKNGPSQDLGIKKWSKNGPSQDLGPLKHH